MVKEGKIWGNTTEIFNNGIVSIHYLEIVKGGFCSEHYHNSKENRFFVMKGSLEITIWRDGIEDKTIIHAGESTVVPTTVWHKFRALTECKCLEIYEASLSSDIFRRTTGGIREGI